MRYSPTARAAAIRLRMDELESRLAPSVAIRFDYSYDTTGFFVDAARKAALQAAANSITARLQDNLAAIVPTSSNSWQASFFNPASNSTITLDNPTIRANEIVVYVAGASIGDSELGLATSGGFSASGSQAWLDTVRGRGQAGALATPQTEYSTWGGMITFDSETDWNFGSGKPAANQYDFTSVALHEIMHVLGFGLGEPAFNRYVSAGKFVGPSVLAAAGAPVAVDGDPADHWAPGTAFHGQPSPMQPALPLGVKRSMTTGDFAALEDIGWQVSGLSNAAPPVAATTFSTMRGPAALAPALEPPAPPPPPTGRFAVGSPDEADVYSSTGELLHSGNPFDSAFPGGVRVATADVNGDAVPDLIAATGPGRSALIVVLDGKSGAELAHFQPFENGFTGGVFVAAADMNGDGKADIAVSAARMGGPVVAVYDGAALAHGQATQFTRFLGIDDPDFRGGARVALGDMNGDGTVDLVVAAGYGGGPRVVVYDGRDVVGGGIPRILVSDFFAFTPDLRNGVYIAVADLDGDGKGELIVGAGPDGAPRVTAFSGAHLLNEQRVDVANFFVGDTANRGGVRVAALDVDGDGRPDLVTGAGTGGQVEVYAAHDLLQDGHLSAWLTVGINGSLPDGVYVG